MTASPIRIWFRVWHRFADLCVMLILIMFGNLRNRKHHSFVKLLVEIDRGTLQFAEHLDQLMDKY